MRRMVIARLKHQRESVLQRLLKSVVVSRRKGYCSKCKFEKFHGDSIPNNHLHIHFFIRTSKFKFRLTVLNFFENLRLNCS